VSPSNFVVYFTVSSCDPIWNKGVSGHSVNAFSKDPMKKKIFQQLRNLSIITLPKGKENGLHGVTYQS